MSHNAKCYVKRIRKKEAAGMPSIAKLFKFASKKNDDSDKSAEIKDCGDESQMEHESEEGEKTMSVVKVRSQRSNRNVEKLVAPLVKR